MRKWSYLLAEVARRLRHGVSQMLFEAERELLMLIKLNEAAWLSRFLRYSWPATRSQIEVVPEGLRQGRREKENSGRKQD